MFLFFIWYKLKIQCISAATTYNGILRNSVSTCIRFIKIVPRRTSETALRTKPKKKSTRTMVRINSPYMTFIPLKINKYIHSTSLDQLRLSLRRMHRALFIPCYHFAIMFVHDAYIQMCYHNLVLNTDTHVAMPTRSRSSSITGRRNDKNKIHMHVSRPGILLLHFW